VVLAAVRGGGGAGARGGAGADAGEVAAGAGAGAAVRNLSALFPDSKIKIEFASEDLGDTCGTIVLLGGVYVERDVDPDQPTTESRSAWRPFAAALWGGPPSNVYGWRAP
jgi:hypothetical protein